ncbi:MAG TPA: L-threonylcarbamoyladenylate synthase [Patescibacteria group bacterium]|nr:L-threonylcarbamoyladenylate synthase [Patescibacteria group bacterium]
MEDTIQHAVEILKSGGIIIYPTDTAFGIGCRIDDNKAVERLFKVRKRPFTQTPPVLFDSLEQVKHYVTSIPEDVEPLLKKYWPGALTVILLAKAGRISPLVVGETGIGCRVPNHEIPLRIIKGLGVPIIGTSANFSGEPTPYHATDLNPQLTGLVDLVIQGETSIQKESTVIDCTQNPWKILRHGAIKIQI